MNGKTGGVRDENGTGRRNAEEAKAGEEVKSGGSESRVRRSAEEVKAGRGGARRKRKQSEGEGSGWSVVQLWVGTGSELRSRWGEMEWVVVYWGQETLPRRGRVCIGG